MIETSIIESTNEIESSSNNLENLNISYQILCPACGADDLHFDGSLILVCAVCGYQVAGGFT